MLKVLNNWYNRYFTDPQAIILLLVLLFGFLAIICFGRILAPVLASLVVAYILEWLVDVMSSVGVPRGIAVITAFTAFLGVLALVVLVLMPMLWQQAITLFNELPAYIGDWQISLSQLPEKYPELITELQIAQLIAAAKQAVGTIGKFVFSTTVASIPTLFAVFIYLIIVPLMVFFFLYDRNQIQRWCLRWLPEEHELLAVVWHDVNLQLGNYVRGKVVEIAIVGITTYITFFVFDLNYAALLSVAVGFSVLLPYIGAAVVTVPVAIVALIQFGWSIELGYIMIAYGIIQALDGNVLVPLLFYEVVNLHPIATITAILLFGGLWGMLGIFFAIPLAILCQSVLNAWPARSGEIS